MKLRSDSFYSNSNLRLAERRDVLRSLNSDCDRVQDTLISNQTAIDRLQNELPKSFENYQFLQEMQSYVRDLVDCLDDKVGGLGLSTSMRSHPLSVTSLLTFPVFSFQKLKLSKKN